MKKAESFFLILHLKHLFFLPYELLVSELTMVGVYAHMCACMRVCVCDVFMLMCILNVEKGLFIGMCNLLPFYAFVLHGLTQ